MLILAISCYIYNMGLLRRKCIWCAIGYMFSVVEYACILKGERVE
jgi:hypothetical protein